MITSAKGCDPFFLGDVAHKENMKPYGKKVTFRDSKRSHSNDSDNVSIVQSLKNMMHNKSQVSQRMHAPYVRQIKMMSMTNIDHHAPNEVKNSFCTPDKKSTVSRLQGDQSIHRIKQPRFQIDCTPGKSVSQLSQLDERSVNSIFVADMFGRHKVFGQEAAKKSKTFSAKKLLHSQADPCHVSLFQVNLAGSKINEIHDEGDCESEHELGESKKKLSALANEDDKSSEDFKKIEGSHERSPSCDLKLNTGNQFEEDEFGLMPIRLQYAEFADDSVSPRRSSNFASKRKDSYLKGMTLRQGGNMLASIPYNFPLSPDHSPAPFNHHPALNNLHLQRRVSKNSRLTRMDIEFEIIKVLGTGSYGKVYQCRNRFDGLEYAIKTIENKSIDEGKHEAAILAYISSAYESSHIVRYYHSWVEESVIYIVTESCLENIEILLDSSNALKVSETLIRKLIKHICKALKKLHGDLIVHLDIKPENILLSKTGKYKLCDFGLATLLKVKKEVVDMTEGDSRYLARELLDEKKWLKVQNGLLDFTKADIFSLGLSVYAIIAKHFFTIPKDGPLWQDLRQGKLEALDSLPEYSGHLKALIRKMVDPNPTLRPSAGEILHYLSTYRLEKESAANFPCNERLLISNNSHLSYVNQETSAKFE